MSYLGRMFICSTRHQIKCCYNPRILSNSANLSFVAEEVRSPGAISNNINGKTYDGNKGHVLSQSSASGSDSGDHRTLKFKSDVSNGPGLKDFIVNSAVNTVEVEVVPYVQKLALNGLGRKVYFEVYGCQMNVNDTEVIWSILRDVGYAKTNSMHEADVILVITCAIREGAETKVWNKLSHFKALKKAREKRTDKLQLKIGILGCMAERLKHQLLEKEQAVDVIAGPDSYKDLPRLLSLTDNNQTAVNVLLSLDETYADVVPVRLNEDSVTAFVSIMRGCDNMCTYCIVPFTRGRERSRPIASILEEIRSLSGQGVKEVTLLGQNVNSYRDMSVINHYGSLPPDVETNLAKGFKTVYKKKKGGLRFADLLDQVSRIDPEMRIRFTSPHPKDFPDEVLKLIRDRGNICSNLHMPAQSGNSAVLERMRRGYTREAYLDLIRHVRELVPGVTLSSDFICGFCGETDEEFEDTLSLMSEVKYNVAYLFAYSLREKTTAHRRFVDDVPPEVKQQRLVRMMSLFRREAEKLNQAQIGQQQLVLVEGPSKRSLKDMAGRNDGNIKVIFPAEMIPESEDSQELKSIKPGDYVVVQINSANSQVLKGTPLYHSSLSKFVSSEYTHLFEAAFTMV
ncbi:CDK5RAP1-like protein [Periplaneta americana]|uniref:CDK5RAP1-like protein n=1 Tax=Periplaneta americana TaxID=6978 RepID=UPI0037E7D203